MKLHRLLVRSLVRALPLGLLWCAATVSAQAPQYTFLDLGTLGDGGSVWATGINASGQVVGYSYRNGREGYSATDTYSAFVSGANGIGLNTIGTLGGTWSQATAINDAGQVAGTAQLADGSRQAFIRASGGGALRALGALPGQTESYATGINANGQVVGRSFTGTPGTQFENGPQGFISGVQGGALRAIGPLGTAPTLPTGINAAGRVSGELRVDSIYPLGFVTGPDGASPASGPPFMGKATAINDEGQYTGWYMGPDDMDRRNAVLVSAGGVMTPLDVAGLPHYDPGWVGGSGQYGPVSSSLGLDVNSAGQVVGSYTNRNLQSSYAFITGADGVGVYSVSELASQAGLSLNFITATGINDAGQFVANAANGHAYLVSLVPEPGQLTLWAAGIGLLVAASSRRRAGLSSAAAVRLAGS